MTGTLCPSGIVVGVDATPEVIPGHPDAVLDDASRNARCTVVVAR